MSGLSHKIYVLTMLVITVVVFVLLALFGADYYLTEKEQRFFHGQNDLLKPSGTLGHGLGFVGFLLIIFGVIVYIARKRIRMFSRLGNLNRWLEFHIFLCSLGVVLVLFHSAFKYAGIAAYSFLGMSLVVLSGVAGLFFYLQVPRTREGRKLTLNELNDKRTTFNSDFQKQYRLDNELIEFLNSTLKVETLHFAGSYFSVVYNHIQYEKQMLFSIKSELILRSITRVELNKIIENVKDDILLNRRIMLFSKMQAYYKYWHIIHLVLVFIMMVVVLTHVVVGVLFGYRWIF